MAIHYGYLNEFAMESVGMGIKAFSSSKTALEVVGRCWTRFGTIILHVDSALDLGALCQALVYILLADVNSYSHVLRSLDDVPCIDDIQTGLIVFISGCRLWHFDAYAL